MGAMFVPYNGELRLLQHSTTRCCAALPLVPAATRAHLRLLRQPRARSLSAGLGTEVTKEGAEGGRAEALVVTSLLSVKVTQTGSLHRRTPRRCVEVILILNPRIHFC